MVINETNHGDWRTSWGFPDALRRLYVYQGERGETEVPGESAQPDDPSSLAEPIKSAQSCVDKGEQAEELTTAKVPGTRSAWFRAWG